MNKESLLSEILRELKTLNRSLGNEHMQELPDDEYSIAAVGGPDAMIALNKKKAASRRRETKARKVMAGCRQ